MSEENATSWSAWAKHVLTTLRTLDRIVRENGQKIAKLEAEIHALREHVAEIDEHGIRGDRVVVEPAASWTDVFRPPMIWATASIAILAILLIAVILVITGTPASNLNPLNGSR